MRYAIFLIASVLLIAPASAAVTPEIDARASLDVVQRWFQAVVTAAGVTKGPLGFCAQRATRCTP